MSESKKKTPSIGHLVLVLFLISAIAALALGYVNSITANKIVAINKANEEAAMAQVLPASNFAEVQYTGDDATIQAVYKADDAGYVVKVAPVGFGGPITMMVGIKSDGTVSGISITNMSETSGLGTNAKKPYFKDQYSDTSKMESDGHFKVNKDGGKIVALTGSTITSRAVTRGVNSALDAAKSMG